MICSPGKMLGDEIKEAEIGDVVCMGEKRNACKIFVGDPVGRRPLWKT